MGGTANAINPTPQIVGNIEFGNDPFVPSAGTLGSIPAISRPLAGQVYKAIAAVAGELAKVGISKDKKNEQQGYRFRGIDDVYNALAPALVAHGLVVLPRVLSREVTERESRNGGVLFYVVVNVEFDLIAVADGSRHTIRTYGEAMDSGDKATNKALSAAYKYAMFQTFCVPTEGAADDADAHTHEPAAVSPVPPAATVAPAPTAAQPVTIKEVDTQLNKNQAYMVVFSDGVKLQTKRRASMETAESYRRDKIAVIYTRWEKNPGYLGDIIPAPFKDQAF